MGKKISPILRVECMRCLNTDSSDCAICDGDGYLRVTLKQYLLALEAEYVRELFQFKSDKDS